MLILVCAPVRASLFQVTRLSIELAKRYPSTTSSTLPASYATYPYLNSDSDNNNHNSSDGTTPAMTTQLQLLQFKALRAELEATKLQVRLTNWTDVWLEQTA